MFIKQVMARPVPTHPKWEYSLNRESMILFFTRKYYMAPMWFMRKAGNNQKKEWHILPYFQQSSSPFLLSQSLKKYANVTHEESELFINSSL